jgi:hypothetical protein
MMMPTRIVEHTSDSSFRKTRMRLDRLFASRRDFRSGSWAPNQRGIVRLRPQPRCGISVG